MSGGVDSSVTAALLREAGYRVIGLFMKNWDEKDANGVCEASKEFADVVSVCRSLDIPYYSVEFIQEYWDRVFLSFLKEYEAGFTPNPDILCNREIKFDAFFEKAMDFGADFLATGHYSRTDGKHLLKGLDPGKDQSYFLHQVAGSRLAKVMFPIGDIHKSEVRKLAERYELSTKAKKDSTGICFIGERNFQPFLAKYLKGAEGPFKTLAGTTVGKHAGVQFYTLGQRKGLGLGGDGDAWFVVGKNPTNNTVLVERGEFHPALYTDSLDAEELNWIAGVAPVADGESLVCRAKVRYRQQDQDCVLTPSAGGTRVHVTFPVPQRSVTPGQSVVFYQGDVCLGGGVIRGLSDNYFVRGATVADIKSKITSSAGSNDESLLLP